MNEDFLYDDFDSMDEMAGIEDRQVYESIRQDLEEEFSCREEEATEWDNYSEDQYYDEDEDQGEDELV